MMVTSLAYRLGRMRHSLLTIWIVAIFVSLTGWCVAAVIAVMALRAVGGLCP